MTKVKVTIADVAQLAGVSISTVSRVINNSAPVTEDLRTKVESAMSTLHYQPNALAQNLKRQALPTIGVLIPDVRIPYFGNVVRGVEDVCFQNGYAVLLCNWDSDPEKEVIYAEELYYQRVSGIIFAGGFAWEEYTDHMTRLLDHGMPLCLIQRPARNLTVDSILVEKEAGLYEAVSHLLDLGHRRIGCITGSMWGGTYVESISGVERALGEADIELDQALVVEAALSPAGGHVAAKQLLTRSDRPSAIVTTSDMLALGVLRAAWELDIKVPGQLSVIGYSDSPFVEYTNPPLSSVREPQYEIGRKAAQCLFERLQNKQLPQRQFIIQPRLITRGTTALREQT